MKTEFLFYTQMYKYPAKFMLFSFFLRLVYFIIYILGLTLLPSTTTGQQLHSSVHQKTELHKKLDKTNEAFFSNLNQTRPFIYLFS